MAKADFTVQVVGRVVPNMSDMSEKYKRLKLAWLERNGWPVPRDVPTVLPTTKLEMPELNSLEKAHTFTTNITELEQALLYKALYLNDMRIDRADAIIQKYRG